MKLSLTKKNRTTVDVVVLEVNKNFLLKKIGKLGKPLSSFTKNCGTFEKAVEKFNNEIKDYQAKKYEIDNTVKALQDLEVFDKAKWHLNEKFPKGLNNYQAYVHTGLYFGWIINNHLISEDFEEENKNVIAKFLRKEMTGTQIYQEQLDGVFSSDELNEQGIEFTKYYFDFEKGTYLDDYDDCLSSDLDSMFYVKDSWENFDEISKFIDNRFEEWRSLKKT